VVLSDYLGENKLRSLRSIDLLLPIVFFSLASLAYFSVADHDLRLGMSVASVGACYVVSRSSAEVRLCGYIAMCITNPFWLGDAINRGDVQQTWLWTGYLLTVLLGLWNSRNALE